MKRRELLRAAGAFAAAGLPFPFALAATPPGRTRYLGNPEPFDYAGLKGQAQALAKQPYVSHKATLPKAVSSLDWDAYQSLRFRDDHVLWADDELRFQAAFFHLGLFFKTPVRMHEIVDGQSHEIAYDPAMFDYKKTGLDKANLPKDLGFAGFRVNFHTDKQRDIAAFLGASYFRAVGGDWQYGLSTRGLAIDCGMDRPEEFPEFISYWLQKPAPTDSRLTVFALMDSPSVAGAYRFDVIPGATLTMDIDAALYPRKAMERMGLAPLTSMYQYGENDRRMDNDWRPEIHDSDGLSMWTGTGEWIWRPLVNPAFRHFNAYLDENPHGFGLLQRDRNFDHYQDDGVFYEKRPSLWVETKGSWGKGSVQLVELPTHDETLDNIVAFWVPADPPKPGEERLFSYRLHWGSLMPFAPTLAQVVATRTGAGGVVGQKRRYFSWRFAIDFAGGDLSLVGGKAQLEPVITASRGKIEITSVRPLAAINGYRAMFDLVPPDDKLDPIDLRLFISVDKQAFSETWLYQYTPPTMAERDSYIDHTPDPPPPG